MEIPDPGKKIKKRKEKTPKCLPSHDRCDYLVLEGTKGDTGRYFKSTPNALVSLFVPHCS